MDPTDRPQFIEHVHKRQLPRLSPQPTFRSSLQNFKVITRISSLPLTVNDVKWVPSSARFVMVPPPPPPLPSSRSDDARQVGSYPKNTGALHMYQVGANALRLSPFLCMHLSGPLNLSPCFSLHTASLRPSSKPKNRTHSSAAPLAPAGDAPTLPAYDLILRLASHLHAQHRRAAFGHG